MIIIGEKLNGSIPSIGKAIAARDEKRIRRLAAQQEEAGADYLDVCASVPEDIEEETLKWMLDLVQEESDLPICLDSPSPNTILKAMKYVKKPGLINSVSMEGDKISKIFPAIADTRWKCIALCSDEKGIPATAERRLEVLDRILTEADNYGIFIEAKNLKKGDVIAIPLSYKIGAATILAITYWVSFAKYRKSIIRANLLAKIQGLDKALIAHGVEPLTEEEKNLILEIKK